MAEPNEPNEWTLMFFLGGDNELAPMMVSELKAIKDAGFQRNTTVMVHFDPNELGAPTRIFNVNLKRKSIAADYGEDDTIGDGRDPYVRNLIEDIVEPSDMDEGKGAATKALKDGLAEPDKLRVAEALKGFLGFCRENHPAKHYMLFLVGHGMIVGNDAFMPDENPVASLSLRKLDEILRGFAQDVEGHGAFELLALHSCSMSSVEVAYQLKGTANYMMATQGLSYIGSWPYRQLLKKTLVTVDRAKKAAAARIAQAQQAGDEVPEMEFEVNIPELMQKIFFLSLYNATDYMMAGYSADISLCSLRGEDIDPLTEKLRTLVSLLMDGLGERPEREWPEDERRWRGRIKELILLAHWKSQSYWQENYTDLFDFCKCLGDACDPADERQKDIRDACRAVTTIIDEPLVLSQHFGSKYQYSHGLSIYFPWSRPLEVMDEEPEENEEGEEGERPAKGILRRYKRYAFTRDMGEGRSWLDFLNRYFERTRRDSRIAEDGLPAGKQDEYRKARHTWQSGPLSNGKRAASLAEPSPSGKPVPSVGIGCGCPTIKNFAEEVREDKGKQKRLPTFSISEGALKAFE